MSHFTANESREPGSLKWCIILWHGYVPNDPLPIFQKYTRTRPYRKSIYHACVAFWPHLWQQGPDKGLNFNGGGSHASSRVDSHVEASVSVGFDAGGDCWKASLHRCKESITAWIVAEHVAAGRIRLGKHVGLWLREFGASMASVKLYGDVRHNITMFESIQLANPLDLYRYPRHCNEPDMAEDYFRQDGFSFNDWRYPR